jgi:tRNA-uridine 2-sulfurtransferase
MSHKKAKVVVALSGGLDSSVATALLLEAGYDCLGAFMITSEQNRHAQAEAEQVAQRLGIELAVLDLREQFAQILDYFFNEYQKARTPNPCIVCNRTVKFGKLWDFAREAGARFLATGHYARILPSNGRPRLFQAAHLSKDQSYVLSMVDRDVLDHVLLPLGDYSKDETRAMAAERQLGTETKAESQEICFIPNDDYVAVLEQHHPELVRQGPIVDADGNQLGTHEGIHRYTIGQRRGLRVAMGKPYYVTGLDAERNTVVLGPKAEVMHRQLRATDVNWLIDTPAAPFAATVKIRYNDRGKPATVVPNEHGVHVEFDEPNLAITPGQLAVFYIEENAKRCVAGAGWIERAED